MCIRFNETDVTFERREEILDFRKLCGSNGKIQYVLPPVFNLRTRFG